MPDTPERGFDDLDTLVSELHRSAPAVSTPEAADTLALVTWLRQVRELEPHGREQDDVRARSSFRPSVNSCMNAGRPFGRFGRFFSHCETKVCI